MKSMIVVALALVAVAVALPVEQQVKILRADIEQSPEGSYKVNFETSDGTKRTEEGVLKDVLDEENKSHSVVVVRGSYVYTNPDGTQENINYYADESGFHADGPSVPKATRR